MKKTYKTVSFKLLSLCLILAFFTFSIPKASAQEGDPVNGKSLFKTNCAACHKLDKKLVGPALAGVTQRRDKDWLYAWIKNNAELRNSGDKDAIAIYEEYGKSPMQAFPLLSDQDIADILAYTDNPPQEAAVEEVAVVTTESEDDNSEAYLNAILAAIFVFTLLLVILLIKIKNTLRKLQGEEESSIAEEFTSFPIAAAKNKFVIGLSIMIFSLVALYGAWDYMLGIGIDEGYQPIQPIAFSHELHAGQNEIDCQYCHSSAKHSKHSGIPSANVCMNCHKYIQEGPNYGTEEISKIYASIGFDPSIGQYIKGYEEKPIKWIRIHNLPDFAYFNHSQHVTAGGLDCVECHGPVEEMEEVYQYSDLSMGWCIQCHRDTEVDVKNNAYYESIHKALAEKQGVEKVTVDMIGGLECGKCHY